MTIQAFPVKFEIHEGEEPYARVEAFDEACANIIIDIPVTVALWDTLAPAIRQCLVDMKLEG